jgi:hypothetical protein
MAGAAGLEPVTSAVTGQRSNQLSYAPANEQGKLGDEEEGVKRNLKLFQLFTFFLRERSGSRRQGGGGGEPR